MSPALRFLVAVLILLAGVLPVRTRKARLRWSAAPRSPIPLALRELDRGRFGLGRILLPARSADTPLTNSQLFALPSMAPVRKALDDEFDRYIARHKADLPNETIGVGSSFDFQLFDRALLYSDRFTLRAVGHRQPDGPRLCLAEANCGEIRLIYRLTRTDVRRRRATPRPRRGCR